MIINDMNDALFLCNLVVTHQLGSIVHKNPEDINITLTFTDGWPEGHALIEETYYTLCNNVEESLRKTSGRNIHYDPTFVIGHKSPKSVNDFIIDSAKLLLAAPLGLYAQAVAEWAAENGGA